MGGTVYLVRHGQANFFEEEYDRLSDVGRRQAERAAEVLCTEAVHLLVSGTLERQRQTARVMLDVFRARGMELIHHEDPGWNEFDPRMWLAKAMELSARDASFGRKFESFRAARKLRSKEAAGLFGELTVEIVREWERASDDTMDFRVFVRTVKEAADRALGHEGSAIAVTSGTPIAVLLADRRGLAPVEACRFFQEVPNASITEIHASTPGQVPPSPRFDHLDGELFTLV